MIVDASAKHVLVPIGLIENLPLLLYRNKGDRTFDEISGPAGLNDGAMQSRRGVAFGDINNDGNIDMVIFNVGARPSLFLNDTKNSSHRALFKLIGTKSNRGAVGARITVTSASRSQNRRSQSRFQLSFNQRSALAFRIGGRFRDGQGGNPLAQWRRRDSAKHSRRRHLHDCRRPGGQEHCQAPAANCLLNTLPSPGQNRTLIHLGSPWVSRGSSLFTENVVDDLEGLLKHDLRGDYPLVGELVPR
jgi:hypothetical protein